MDDSILHPDNGSRRRNLAGIAERVERMDWIVYSPRQHGYERTVLAGNATVHPTQSLTKLHFFRDAFRLGCRLHDERGYDLICVQDPMGSGLVGYWLRRRCGLPLLVKCHSDYYSSKAWRSESLRYRLLDHRLSAWLLRRADHVQVVSPQLAQDVARLGVDPERVTVLPTIMQTYLFKPGADSPERYGAGRLLFAGRLARQKDIPTLLGAARLLADRGREYRLTVVGGGPQRKRLLALRDRLGVESQVEFISHKPREELVDLYRQSSIFVIASVHEAFGKVIVEAGLCGLPIIGTAVGGIPWHVVDGENGLLVPPRDPAALAAAVARLLDDPALARNMGQEAQRRFRDKWRYEDMVDAHVGLLKRVAGGAAN
ncbi:MAG: glycosyltransferase [Planctomycetota bacterium]